MNRALFAALLAVALAPPGGNRGSGRHQRLRPRRRQEHGAAARRLPGQVRRPPFVGAQRHRRGQQGAVRGPGRRRPPQLAGDASGAGRPRLVADLRAPNPSRAADRGCSQRPRPAGIRLPLLRPSGHFPRTRLPCRAAGCSNPGDIDDPPQVLFVDSFLTPGSDTEVRLRQTLPPGRFWEGREEIVSGAEVAVSTEGARVVLEERTDTPGTYAAAAGLLPVVEGETYCLEVGHEDRLLRAQTTVPGRRRCRVGWRIPSPTCSGSETASATSTTPGSFHGNPARRPRLTLSSSRRWR